MVSISNAPGEHHAQALAMQASGGAITLDSQAFASANLGSRQSTYLGMNEMQQASQAMRAQISLTFREECTTFSLRFKLIIATATPKVDTDLPPLPAQMWLVAADDDRGARVGFKGIAKVPVASPCDHAVTEHLN